MAYADKLNETEHGWTPREALKNLVFMLQTDPASFEALLPCLQNQAKTSSRGSVLLDIQVPR